MAKASRSQGYPRIEDETHRFYGYLNDDALVGHQHKLEEVTLKEIILEGILYANAKSSRKILVNDEDIQGEELIEFYKKKGRELFTYFIKYCGDPASTAYDSLNQHYKVIAEENFRNRTLQKERMNSGWRYQYIAKDSARHTGRFETISDLNSIEADFNAAIRYKNSSGKLNIYVSIKNRSNTMGGQDWPKAITALENAAVNDKNRSGHYLCIFGIAMERGLRNIKGNKNSGMPYSMNTEVWNSDFFWPFFTNVSYEEIVKAVLDVLVAHGDQTTQEDDDDIEIPDELIEEFGKMCNAYALIDEEGKFNDAYRLVDLFCGKIPMIRQNPKTRTKKERPVALKKSAPKKEASTAKKAVTVTESTQQKSVRKTKK